MNSLVIDIAVLVLAGFVGFAVISKVFAVGFTVPVAWAMSFMLFQAIMPSEGEASLILENNMIAVLLCFLATALNREGSGRTREEIVALSRLRERVA